jgi:hypothetical protein
MVLAASGLSLGAGAAHADLSWEHTGSLQFSTQKQPVMRLKMYNHWTAQRHRLLFKYSVHDLTGLNKIGNEMPSMGFPMLQPNTHQQNADKSLQALLSAQRTPSLWNLAMSVLRPALAPKAMTPNAPAPKKIQNYGALGFIQSIDNDRLIAYDSQTAHYISEPRFATLKRLRFDPWKKLDPRLSRETPPAFTTEQRARLMDELRALVSPLSQKMQKLYFRPLNEARTIRGIPGRGYRMTQLNNVGGLGKNQAQWMRTTFEWWVASSVAGDDTIRAYREAARAQLGGMAWPPTHPIRRCAARCKLWRPRPTAQSARSRPRRYRLPSDLPYRRCNARSSVTCASSWR